MADKTKKITDMDELQNVNDDAVLYVVQDGKDKKIRVDVIIKKAKKYIDNELLGGES